GGSGGGFAALRASAAVPSSCAFVQDATVGLENHNPTIVETYFRKASPGWDQEKLLSAFPEFFNMHLHYRRRVPRNFVFMTQSLKDKGHLGGHFEHFARAHGIPTECGVSRRGGRVLKAYSPKMPGHGKITSAEFDYFYKEWISAWSSWESSKLSAIEAPNRARSISTICWAPTGSCLEDWDAFILFRTMGEAILSTASRRSASWDTATPN